MQRSPRVVRTPEQIFELMGSIRDSCKIICEELPRDRLEDTIKELEKLRRDPNVRIVCNQLRIA